MDDYSTTPLAIHSRRHGETVVIALAGEYDIVSKGRLAAEMPVLDVAAVVLDLSELEFMDSSGLSDIVALRQTTERHGVALSVRGAARNVRQIFEMTKLDDMLED